MPVKWIYWRDRIAEFIESIIELRRYAKPIILDISRDAPSQGKKIEEKRDCHICRKDMGRGGGEKDLDHDHQTG